MENTRDFYKNKKCINGQVCPLYQYIYTVYDERDDSAYTIMELVAIKNRWREHSICTLDEVIEALYGRHCCTIKQMSTITVNEDVARRIINSYNLEAKDDIYDVCYNKWFRKLVPMLPLTNKKKLFIERKENSK